jgi:uncharacterized ion transporter superfamily protein YfcC
MPLKYFLPIARKLFLALAILMALGAVLSFAEGMLGYGRDYFRSGFVALVGMTLFYGLARAVGAAAPKRP